MKKLRAKAGESIGETLVAVLIMALVFLMLTGAVVTAARINDRIKVSETTFDRPDPATENASDLDVTISVGGESVTVTTKLHQTENGYYYYD